MKILSSMVLMASLIAIACAAMFQFFLLLSNMLFGHHTTSRQATRLN